MIGEAVQVFRTLLPAGKTRAVRPGIRIVPKLAQGENHHPGRRPAQQELSADVMQNGRPNAGHPYQQKRAGEKEHSYSGYRDRCGDDVADQRRRKCVPVPEQHSPERTHLKR